MKESLRQFPLALAYEQSRETWDNFDVSQKRHAILASVVTFGRVGLRLATEIAYDSGKLSRRRAIAAHVVLDLADAVDGRVSRRGNAVTPWGKVADPFSDKVDFFVQEVARARRGELYWATVATRAARDIVSTQVRHNEAIRADEEGREPQTGATNFGKMSTTMRALANRVNDVSPNSVVARVFEHTATVGLVGSLIQNTRSYRSKQ